MSLENVETALAALCLLYLVKMWDDFSRVAQLKRREQLIAEYRAWRNALKLSSLSKLEREEIEHEGNTILELLGKGREVDVILRRRLEKVKDRRREDTRHS